MDRFPDSFLWGATLHSHCVEGEHFDSDWWRWEQRPGNIVDGSSSQYGVNHWKLFGGDVRLAGEFGMNTLLITLEWSRIEPLEGDFCEEALRHYRDVFEACVERGITVVCGLQHVTLPQWMASKGGWLNSKSPDWFREYVKRVLDELGDLCGYWIPLYEPMHGLVEGYQQGVWPPERSSPLGLNRAMRNQLTAHRYGCTRIRKARSDARVGWSVRATSYVPGNPYSAWDARIAVREAGRNNHRMLERLLSSGDAGSVDFIGMSYFGRQTLSVRWRSPLRSFVRHSGQKGSGTEYGFDPESLGRLLVEYKRYSLPIMVTGNGCPHVGDEEQCGYLLDHVEVVRDAMNEGVEILGYVYHSLLNGFEWNFGFTRRYGLMVVDRERMTRSPNSIALLYKELCETGEVRDATVAGFCPGRIREEVVS